MDTSTPINPLSPSIPPSSTPPKPSSSFEDEISKFLPQLIQPSLYTPVLYFEDFENTQVVKEYICCLCKGVTCDAILDSCNHLFCSKCFKTFQSLSGDTIKCPIQGTIFKEYPPLFTFGSEIVSKQITFCHYKSEGCSFRGEVKKYLIHLNNECPKMKVKCSLEGCQDMVAREMIKEHESKCEFRSVECEYCKEKVQYLKLVSHHSMCPKYKLECALGCGCVVEREGLEEHVKNVCNKAIVKCECEMFGCEVQCIREKMNEHVKIATHEHMVLMFRYFNNENKKLKQIVETEIKKIEDKMILFNNHQQQPIQQLQLQTNNYLGKKTERSSSSITSPLPSQTNTTSQQQQPPQRQVLPPTKGFSRPSPLSIDESNPNTHNTNTNTNTNINGTNINNPIPIINEQTPSFPNDQSFIQIKNLSEKPACFDMINLPPGFKITNNTIKMTATSTSSHKYIFASNNVSNNKKTVWKVTFLNQPKWIGFGLCDKTTVLNNKMLFYSTNRLFNHGSFLISTNTFSWNCKVVKENNAFLNCPKMKKGDVVLLEYNPMGKELLIKCGSLHKKLTEVEPVESTELTICFVFLSEGDEVELTMFE